ncbi:MAG: hypothetical protein M1831_006581 [Alyxoria varia]|nr:MAG: hypothetical protein M1831_006581 [Alyxoria varia]
MLQRQKPTGSTLHRPLTVRRRGQSQPKEPAQPKEPEHDQRHPPRIPSFNDLNTSFVAGSIFTASSPSLPAPTEPVKRRRLSRFYEALPDTRGAAYSATNSTGSFLTTPSAVQSKSTFWSSSQSLNAISTRPSTAVFKSTASIGRCDECQETQKVEGSTSSDQDKANLEPSADDDLCAVADHSDANDGVTSAMTSSESQNNVSIRKLGSVTLERVCGSKNAVKKRARWARDGTLLPHPSLGP